MTDKEIDKLADLIADKLIAKQQEYDEQFHIDLQETMEKEGGFIRQVSEEELILAEIARLMTLLSSYEDRELYEKAAIINRKINHLKNKLNNL
jgi:protein-arginine kinase activator protein McsA|tara:strand:- start:1157 stop:1435 length:279 start_codon:yes stop_codon:yes gene_type:complete